MGKVKLDAQRRLELPSGEPGEEYEIQPQGEGRYLLIRVEKATPSKRPTKEEIMESIRNNPIEFSMTWDELRKITRDL